MMPPVHLRQHINLFILFIQQVLQLPHLGFESANALFQGFSVASWERAPTQLVAGLALKADIGTLRARRAYTIAANLL